LENFPDLKITISIGISSVKKTKSKMISELVGIAGKMMYEAKNNHGKIML